MSKDVSSIEVQEMIQELIDLCNQGNSDLDMGENYWAFMAENYLSNPVFINATNKKYGEEQQSLSGRH